MNQTGGADGLTVRDGAVAANPHCDLSGWTHRAGRRLRMRSAGDALSCTDPFLAIFYHNIDASAARLVSSVSAKALMCFALLKPLPACGEARLVPAARDGAYGAAFIRRIRAMCIQRPTGLGAIALRRGRLNS
jgi:hypothetical protein